MTKICRHELEYELDLKKAAIWGLVTFAISMLAGNLLYMNPLVYGIFQEYEGHHSTKSMDYFGGIGNWLFLTMLFGICLNFFFIVLYLTLHRCIPGNYGFKKGFYFGLMIGIIKAIPEAFNQWMLFDYPTILILIQMINTLIGLLIFGIVLAVLYKKFQVIIPI